MNYLALHSRYSGNLEAGYSQVMADIEFLQRYGHDPKGSPGFRKAFGDCLLKRMQGEVIE